MIHWITILVIFLVMTLLFFYAQSKKDNSLVDIFWGAGFCIITTLTLLLSGNFTIRTIIASSFVLIWGLRLTIYLFQRNHGKEEDYRYKAMRKRWGNRQQMGAFLNVFMLQAIFMFIISLPIQMINVYSNNGFHFLDIIGGSIWITGFYFQAVGDTQLKRFKAVPSNKGKIMKSGLWSITRHPNYFGEILMWWGIAIIALNVPYWYLSILGAATITFLLIKVSGVPMLEKKYKNNPEFIEYANKTPALFPWNYPNIH